MSVAGAAELVVEYLSEAFEGPTSCVWVTRPGDALQTLRSERFDVVVLDLVLPDASDVEAVRAVVAAVPDVPVVVSTGVSDERMAERARAVGAWEVLLKDRDGPERVRDAAPRDLLTASGGS